MKASNTSDQRYQRQEQLDDFGRERQEKLARSRVAVVGCGGLGAMVAVQLTASGVGEIHLIDGDKVSLNNLHRQSYYNSHQVGSPKVEELAAYLLRLNPDLSCRKSMSFLNKSNVHKLLKDCDLVLDCTDMLHIKYLLNDYCVINDLVLVYGSLYKHDGYVASFNLPLEGGRSANMRDAFPEIPKGKIPNCAEIGTLNPIVGMISNLQVNECLKILTAWAEPLANTLLIYNSKTNRQYKMALKPTVSKAEVQKIFDKSSYEDPSCAFQNPDWLIRPEDFVERFNDSSFETLSVIEDQSLVLPFEVDHRVPLSALKEDFEWSKDKALVIICQRGISSYAALERLKGKHPEKRMLSLSGGLTALAALEQESPSKED